MLEQIESAAMTEQPVAPGAQAVTVVPGTANSAAVSVPPVAAEPGAPVIPGAFERPSVQTIQYALQNAGLYQGKIDGDIGPKTKKAIKDFQAQNSLTVDGKVGPKTWQRLSPYLNDAGQEAAADHAMASSDISN